MNDLPLTISDCAPEPSIELTIMPQLAMLSKAYRKREQSPKIKRT
jgi:hypothetical protein